MTERNTLPDIEAGARVTVTRGKNNPEKQRYTALVIGQVGNEVRVAIDIGNDGEVGLATYAREDVELI